MYAKVLTSQSYIINFGNWMENSEKKLPFCTMKKAEEELKNAILNK